MDYWDYLRQYGQDAGEAIYNAIMGKYNNAQNVNDFLTDIHPHSEEQYNIQRAAGVIIPGYSEYMRSRSLDEFNKHKKEMYGIEFDDVTYPWLSTLDSTNAMQSAGSGAWEYSRNLARLYR